MCSLRVAEDTPTNFGRSDEEKLDDMILNISIYPAGGQIGRASEQI